MKSIWEHNIEFKTLNGDKNTDVLIVGGGIAGILTAYKLKKSGVDCMLIEADRICNGTTGYTTAKITIAQGLMYGDLINRFGTERAKLYINAQNDALKEYSFLCRDIDCDFEAKDSYVFSRHNKNKIESEIEALNSLGIKAVFSDAGELPISVAGAVCVKKQAQFNPLKFLYTIAQNLPIYEHTKLKELKGNKAVTNRGVITYKKLIVATHFPIFNKHGGYFLKMYQHRSYVLALEGVKSLNGMYVEDSESGLSLRSYNNILLLGGGGHRTGKQGSCWSGLESFAKKHYSSAGVIAKWATQDCMTLDRVAYIGKYSKSTPNVFVATGFNKWGMTNAMVAAKILCDLICEKQNEYADVFYPSRSVLHPQLAVNIMESVLGLITPTAPRCPHLGCALKYNWAEHTWDCSCHGSRFTKNGKLIDGPATDDHATIGK